MVPLSCYHRVELASPPREDLSYAFALVRDGASEASFVFAAPSDAERASWMDALTTSIKRVRAAHAPAPGLAGSLPSAVSSEASVTDGLW